MCISFPYTTSKQFFALVVQRITLDDGEVSGGRRNRRHRDEPVLAVVCVAVAPVAREISVGVVRKRRGIDVVVLVESVRRVVMRDRHKVAACTGGRRAVADRIVEVRVAAIARSASRHLGAFVVRPCARGGLGISRADWPSKRVMRRLPAVHGRRAHRVRPPGHPADAPRLARNGEAERASVHATDYTAHHTASF